MVRIGVYGGSFNPVHLGHVETAKFAVQKFGLTELKMVPSFLSPHKTAPAGSPTPEQRLQMLQLAVAGEAKITVSDLELRRGQVSYTYLTLESLQAEYPDAELLLCMGTDMFLTVDTWVQSEKLRQLATIAVFFRGGKQEKAKVALKKQQLEAAGWKVELGENPSLPLSSTDLRRMLAFGCGESLLPKGVWDFIQQNGLYATGANYRNLPMDQLEKVVCDLLNPNRVAHVLGCRDTSERLAKVWNTDPEDAARAGMLHDVTKALPGGLQLTLCREYGILLDDFSTQNPKTLHALTGSLVAERVFGENAAVVSAIASHTTGKADMNTLEKILYVADYMEPNRDFPGVERLRELADTDLDEAMILGLEMTLEHVRNQGSALSPESAQALAFLKEQRKG